MDYNFNPVPDNNSPDAYADDSKDQTEPAAQHGVAEGGILGVVGGAVVGGLAGGPLGAVIGAVVGGVASAAAVEVVDNLHDSAQTISTDNVEADNHKSDVDTTHNPTPNMAYYTAPGAFGTSLPGVFAPPVIDETVTNADKDSALVNTESL